MLQVQDQSPEVEKMAEEWPLLDALMGGTRAMREMGQALLPKWPNEEAAAHTARLNTATLYPAFRRTVSVMAGKPFSKELVLSEDAPPRIRELAENIDAQGTSLHVFASRICAEAISHGICGILVDHTRATEVRTLADERTLGARPYFVHVKHDQILGWRVEQAAGGVNRLVQLRLAETTEVPDGPYGTKTVARVRVLFPGSYELWEESFKASGESKGFSLIEAGPMAPLTEIPFVPMYGERCGFLQGKSALLDLAYLNVKHWQSQSDQDTILHVARVPILAVMGIEDPTHEITVGSSAAVKLPMNADMKYVEHTGAAITSGKESLADLEQQMIQTGAELLVQKPGVRTATEANNDAEGNKSDLQRLVESLEDALDMALQHMADWLRLPSGGSVSLYKDFAAATLTDASAQLVVAMHQAGLITKATSLREMQRRGMIAADLDVDKEIEAAEVEGPPLGLMGNNDADDERSPPGRGRPA